MARIFKVFIEMFAVNHFECPVCEWKALANIQGELGGRIQVHVNPAGLDVVSTTEVQFHATPAAIFSGFHDSVNVAIAINHLVCQLCDRTAETDWQ
jgi:hypothetical protein